MEIQNLACPASFSEQNSSILSWKREFYVTNNCIGVLETFLREWRWKLKQDIYMKETAEFTDHKWNPVAQLGNEEGNPTTQVPLQVEGRSGFAGGRVLIPVPRISSSVCLSGSSL